MSKCIKCGNLYFSEPYMDCKMCFRCVLVEKDNRIKELEQQCIDLKEYNDARIKELENQINKWKQDYENCYKLEKILMKEHQHCLDNWRECEKENQQLKENLVYEKNFWRANNKTLKQKAIIPKCCIGCKLYMIPTKFNGLNMINEYVLMSITFSDIGLRYEMSLCKKERGIEPFYCASEDMFNVSIFFSKEDAEKTMREKNRGNKWNYT